jgi:hypothetical protein
MPPPKDDRTLLSGPSDPVPDDLDKPVDSGAATTTGAVSLEGLPGVIESEARQLAWSWVSRRDVPNFSQPDRFVEKGLIGVGGMSTVVRAFDKDLRREVAIKVLSPELSTNRTEVERFAAEARITGQLEHPYIVPVYEFGTDAQGNRFLCMRLVEGQTLEDVLMRAGIERLETDKLADVLQIFVKVCEAVSFAHSRGIIHRDLKPSNIMISDFGQVYVLDWGVARSSTAAPESGGKRVEIGRSGERDSSPDPPGALVGTPCYMAPEQLRGSHAEIDERTDVFTLGATLYQILTGQPPRPPDSIRSILIGKSRFEITPPEQIVGGAIVPVELSRIAQKAMSHEPEGRYASVSELRGDVERFLRGSWHLPRVHFPAGSTIVREAEQGESAYIIVEGRCVAFRSDGDADVVLREMGPGEVFGETAVFSKKPRTASVRAVTDLVVMVVTSDILSKALGLNFWMGTFVKALADRFRDVDERLRQFEAGERHRSLRPK